MELHEKRLLKTYKSIFDKQCREKDFTWAAKFCASRDIIPPTIPFVGNNYNFPKILVYASAENLTNGGLHLSDYGEGVYYRHRYAYDEKNADFFPNVNCQPISDGGLTLAVAYLCKKRLNLKIPHETPQAFLDSIAFGNFCKFAANGNKNDDKAAIKRSKEYSLPYIEEDLKELQPNYLFIPQSYNKYRNLLERFIPSKNIIQIYQINSRVINTTIGKKYTDKAAENKLKELGLFNWYQNLKWSGKSKENYLKLFDYLDSTISIQQ